MVYNNVFIYHDMLSGKNLAISKSLVELLAIKIDGQSVNFRGILCFFFTSVTISKRLDSFHLHTLSHIFIVTRTKEVTF